MSAVLAGRYYQDVPGCVHCGAPVRTTNYALGPEVEHYDPAAGFPSKAKGTAWVHCRLSYVATMPEAAAQKVPT